MGLTGDFHKLAKWQSSIEGLASNVQVARVSEAMAKATLAFIDEEFAQGRGPTGAPWAPKKHPNGRPVGHGKTGRLAKYRIKSASALGFAVHNPAAPHRKFFHGGTRRMVARPITPGSALPRRWASAYERIWTGYCHSKLRG